MFHGYHARVFRVVAGVMCISLALWSFLAWNQPPWSTIVRVFWTGFGIYALFREPTARQIRSLAGRAEQDEGGLVQIAQGPEVPNAYGLLKAQGIPAVCQSSESFLLEGFSHLWPRARGVPDLLLVPHRWKDKALALLDSRVSDRELDAAARASLPPEDRGAR